MKLLRSIQMIALVLTTTAATAFAFEGKINMQMTTDKGQTIPITYQIKDAHVRVDTTVTDAKRGKSMTMSTIPHPELGETHMLMHENKMLMVMKNQDVQELTAAASKKANETPFKFTGRKEKIAGMEAEEMVGNSDGKLTEIWVTKEIGGFVMAGQGNPMSRSQPAPQSWASFAKDGKLFPLRVVQREKEGGPEKFRFEAVKVEKTSIPDSTFETPADYQRLPSMGDMMRGAIPGASTH